MFLLASAIAPPAFFADEPENTNLTTHLLIGMTPNQGFEVTCEDSVLYRTPVVSSGLGIIRFLVDYRKDPLPNTITIRVPGPPVITEEVVSSPGDSVVVIAWTTDRPATSQVEHGRTQSYGALTPVDSRLTAHHAVAVAPLEAETTYHYRVISVDAYGNRSTSEDHAFQTLPERPRVTDVVVAGTTATTVTLRWSTSRPCDSRIEYGLTATYGNATPVDPALVTEHEVTVAGLAPGTLYHLRAASRDEFGRTALSGDRAVTTDALALLITNVAVVDTTATTATVTWTTTNPATSTVEYGLGTSYGRTISDEQMVRAHVIVLPDLEASMLYHFRVMSRDAQGSLVASPDHTFTTTPGDIEVSSVSIADVTATTMDVLWTTTMAADSQVEYGLSSAYGSVTDVLPDLVTEHRVTIRNLAPGTTYHVRARSRNIHGHVAVSADQVAPTLAPELLIAAVGVADTTATTATIAWTTTNPATGRVEYGLTASYGSSSPTNAVPRTEHEVVLVDLAPRTLYHFRISAVDIHGQERVSGDHVFSTSAAVQPGGLVISGVAVAAVGATHARIAWSTNAAASSLVEYGTTPDLGGSVSSGCLVTSHSILVRDLVPGTLYYFRVRSEDAGQHEAASQSRTFRTDESDFAPPQVPAGLEARPCPGGVTLSWLPNVEDDLDGYRLYRRPEGDLSFSFLAERPAADTECLDEDVAAGVLYEYSVAAFDAVDNESAPSAAVPATPGLAGGPSVWVFPNPVREGTTIRFSSPAGEPGSTFSAAIYDAGGRHVRSLVGGRLASGMTSVSWNVDDDDGTRVASGTYFCVITFPTGVVRAKLMVLR